MSNDSLSYHNIRIKLSFLYLPNGLSHCCRLAVSAAKTQMEIENANQSTNRSVVLMEKPMGTSVCLMKPKGKVTLLGGGGVYQEILF